MSEPSLLPPSVEKPGAHRVLSATSFLAAAALLRLGLACASSGGTSTSQGALPQQPVIMAPATVTALQGGYRASVPALPGPNYPWSIDGGSLPPGGDTQSSSSPRGRLNLAP